MTVSYTHLRAHETVLDLVCRLLLEKKNVVTQEGLVDSYSLPVTGSNEQGTSDLVAAVS